MKPILAIPMLYEQTSIKEFIVVTVETKGEEFRVPFTPKNIPNRLKYYNSNVRILVPGNFNIVHDPLYTFAGMHFTKNDNVYEFFANFRSYAAFQRLDLKCYMDDNTIQIRMVDSSNDITYKADYDELLVEGFKMATINIFRFRIITAKDLDVAMINGLSGLNCHNSDNR
ncbi:Uncharacterized protein CTYZ_00002704 [Cryptosporidium tyzzeri]|nr:Uncharacterized protein CTYZ_00002704 [Cryptosporidium tyzzeri]